MSAICTVLTEEELALYSQEHRVLLCPMCRNKFGRSGPTGPNAQHLREKFSGYCACCRRYYQREYQKARYANLTDVGKVIAEAAMMTRLRNQIKTWYAKGHKDEANKLLLPELNLLETEHGHKVTLPRHIEAELFQEALDRNET